MGGRFRFVCVRFGIGKGSVDGRLVVGLVAGEAGMGLASAGCRVGGDWECMYVHLFFSVSVCFCSVLVCLHVCVLSVQERRGASRKHLVYEVAQNLSHFEHDSASQPCPSVAPLEAYFFQGDLVPLSGRVLDGGMRYGSRVGKGTVQWGGVR